jgi:hypothetical protein
MIARMKSSNKQKIQACSSPPNKSLTQKQAPVDPFIGDPQKLALVGVSHKVRPIVYTQVFRHTYFSA